MKRLSLFITTLLIAFLIVGCDTSESDRDRETSFYQRNLDRIGAYATRMPENYATTDYKQKARDFDAWLFDHHADGPYLPLIHDDNSNNTFRFPAYVGDSRTHSDGSQEGVSVISAVLSATLVGIDKSDQGGRNYVDELNAFFSNQESVVLNNIGSQSRNQSLWYKLYPGILFTQVALQYPDEERLQANALDNIESWYQAYRVFDQNGSPDYNYTKFNFSTMQPINNNRWVEPDSAAGIGMLMYYGYHMSGEQKYLEALIGTMDYLDAYQGSPLYEVLLFYAPYLAADLNAEHGTNYDIEKLIDNVFSGQSIPRGGWGSIIGNFGNTPMDGLFGSTTDRGGYAFSMNTFAAAFSVPGFVQYDARYASSIGGWLLHLYSNSRAFFPDGIDSHYQSCDSGEPCENFNTLTNNSFPYEGIINGYASRTPYVGGDPLIMDWAQTDLSIYSGAATGMLGSMIETTNIEGILKSHINALAMTTYPYEIYLLYNPHDEEKSVDYHISSQEAVDLYDLVTQETIATSANGVVSLKIDAKDSVVIAELPANTPLTKEDLRLIDAAGRVITQDQVSTSVISHESGETVSGSFELVIGATSSVDEDTIATIELQIGSQLFVVDNTSTIKLNTENIPLRGGRTLRFTITMESGLQDRFTHILRLE